MMINITNMVVPSCRLFASLDYLNEREIFKSNNADKSGFWYKSSS